VNGVHDLGGQHGHGPVVVERDEPVFHAAWEGRVYALMRLALGSGLFNLDEMRRAIESMPPADYLASSYYQRWLFALEKLAAEKGVTGAGPVAPTGRNSAPPPGIAARFAAGDRVRARNLNPRHHTRLARYVRGRRGIVESVHSPALLPDLNAYGGERRWEPVYTVVFEAGELWGAYADPRGKVSIDLWESYLEEDR
jgi:nitrile hydratase